MKIVHVAALAAIVTLGFASQALAHGGSGFRGPGGMAPPGWRGGEPPPPPCVCADVDCGTCSASDLRSGTGLAMREQETQVLRSWPDLRTVRITCTFRAKEDGPIEAFASIRPGTAFGVTAASIEQRDTRLVAALTDGDRARRRYLETRYRLLDPLLLTRRGPGDHDLRAFPVRGDSDTVVVIEGLVLPDEPCRRTRIYREGDLYLAVVRLPEDGERDVAALVDARNGRALHFVSGREARARFGQRARQAEEVFGIAALERAVKGKDDRVWVALEREPAPATGGPPAGPRDPAPPPPPPPPDEPSPVPSSSAPPLPPTPVDPVVTAPVGE